MSKSASAPSSGFSIRQYYEHNTHLFLLGGRQGGSRAIHRAVWAPGVGGKQAALNYTNQLILNHLLELAEANTGETLRAADLGCGVGGSLFYLSSRMPSSFWGVGLTISPSQAQLAQRYAAQLGLVKRCAFIEADFQHPPLAGRLDTAFSIEAFAHSLDPAGYLREASRLLRSGGRLILCDDFRSNQGKEDDDWLLAFRSGWQVPALTTSDRITETAESYGLGLRLDIDLTPYLRISTAPVWLARAIARSGSVIKHPYWQSITGGVALQQCLKRRLVSYRFLVFDKTG